MNRDKITQYLLSQIDDIKIDGFVDLIVSKYEWHPVAEVKTDEIDAINGIMRDAETMERMAFAYKYFPTRDFTPPNTRIYISAKCHILIKFKTGNWEALHKRYYINLQDERYLGSEVEIKFKDNPECRLIGWDKNAYAETFKAMVEKIGVEFFIQTLIDRAE